MKINYENMDNGTVLETHPVWRVQTRRNGVVSALALDKNIGIKPEGGDSATVGLAHGVWKIIGLI